MSNCNWRNLRVRVELIGASIVKVVVASLPWTGVASAARFPFRIIFQIPRFVYLRFTKSPLYVCFFFFLWKLLLWIDEQFLLFDITFCFRTKDQEVRTIKLASGFIYRMAPNPLLSHDRWGSKVGSIRRSVS